MSVNFSRFIFLLFLLLSFSRINGHNHVKNYGRLKVIDAENGLSSGSVSCLLKDSMGYIWVGTYYGLNRYNGYEAESFMSRSNDPSALSNDFITALFEDNSGNLWVGTKKGLCRYNYSQNRFYRITEVISLVNKVGTGLKNEHIGTIFKGSDDKIYVGTMGGGLYYLNDSKNKLIAAVSKLSLSRRNSLRISAGLVLSSDSILLGTYDNGLCRYNSETDELECYDFPGMEINDIYYSRDRRLWIATNNMGLYVFDPDSSSYEKVDLKNANNESVPIIMDIEADNEGNLLLATDGAGILSVNIRHQQQNFKSETVERFFNLNIKGIRAILMDDFGITWIGTIGKGLQKYNPRMNQFLFPKQESPTSGGDGLTNENIIDLFQDNNNNIWIGTDGGGLNVYSFNEGNIKPCSAKYENDFFEKNEVIRRIFQDEEGELWLGTYGNGISVFSPSKPQNHQTFYVGAGEGDSVHTSHVWSVEKARNNKIWTGTLGRGLFLLDKETGKEESLEELFPLAAQQMNPYILSLSTDADNRLWVGTSNGVTRFSADFKSFKTFLYDSLNNSGVGVNTITDIYHDEKGSTWLSTNGGGVVIINKKDELEILDSSKGLSHDKVYDVFQDLQKNYWIATYKGLNRYSGKDTEILTLDARDGLNSSVIQTGICLKNGDVLIGTPKGLNLFNPSSLKLNQNPPRVILEKLYVDNREINPGDDSRILNKALSYTREITLNPDENSFSIKFTGLNYIMPGKNLYSYRLNGVSTDWSPPSEIRWAQFNNLPPGKYTLEVKAVNSSGKWSENFASVGINVLPPWYKTTMAFIIFLLVLATLIFIYIRYTVFLMDMKRKLNFEKKERQRMEELDQMRVQFFTNISHEFRTPLTLINTPLEKLLNRESFPPDVRKNLNTAYNNTTYLARLIDQVMDFSKVETGNMDLRMENDDFAGFAIRCASQLKGLADDKNISFETDNKIGHQHFRFDKNIVEKIIYNLMSNAIKFTRRNGTIVFSVFKVDSNHDKLVLGIEVNDNGIGISEHDLKNLFTRYRQFDKPVNQFQSGTGIGLSLVKQLVELHKGEINVESKLNEGSTFKVHLEVYPTSNQDGSTLISPVVFSPGEQEIGASYQSIKDLETLPETASKNQTQKILLVEDNQEVLSMMKDNLSEEFKVFGASNGREALEWLSLHDVDMVISDVVMPEIGGIELCKRIKSNINYSHIPVILISARDAAQDKIDGVNHGADLYLSKPFNSNLLKAYIHGILVNRERVREFLSTYLFSINGDSTNHEIIEEQFLKNVVTVVRGNLDNELFSVEDLCERVGMSRSNLHRKLKALVGKSTTGFIRSFRLKEAAALLVETDLQITEVAGKTGFGNVSHFIKVFKQEYSVSPKLYRNSKRGRAAGNAL